MVLVAKFYGLLPRVLPAIQAVERGYAGDVESNINGSADLGVMQTNTLWISRVSSVQGFTRSGRPQPFDQLLLFRHRCGRRNHACLFERNHLPNSLGSARQVMLCTTK
jgi:hypothetical protein